MSDNPNNTETGLPQPNLDHPQTGIGTGTKVAAGGGLTAIVVAVLTFANSYVEKSRQNEQLKEKARLEEQQKFRDSITTRLQKAREANEALKEKYDNDLQTMKDKYNDEINQMKLQIDRLEQRVSRDSEVRAKLDQMATKLNKMELDVAGMSAQMKAGNEISEWLRKASGFFKNPEQPK